MNSILALLIYNIPIPIFFYFTLPKLLTPRKSVRHSQTLIICIHIFALLILMLISYFTISYTFIWLVGLIFLVCTVPFKESIAAKLFFTFFIYFILGTGEGITSFILVFLNYVFPSLNLTTYFLITDGTFKSVFVFIVIYSILLFLIYKFFVPILQSYLALLNTKIALQLSFPMTFLLLMVNLLFSYVGPLKIYFLLIAIFSILFVCCCVYFTIGISSLKRMNEQDLENKIMQKQLTLQISHSYMLDREYAKIRAWNHDVSNHLLSISYLIERGDYSEADQYIENILSQYENINI